MLSLFKLYLLLWLIVVFPLSLSVDPISGLGAATAVVFSAVYAGWEYTKCKREECCDNKWIKLDISGLKSALKHSLHGQHLVEQVVPKAVGRHVTSKSPPKALVMSFHGWTGSGKNHVSKIIAENLYTLGMKSDFVHLYIPSHHFFRSGIEESKRQIKEDIEKSTKACARNLFIFDELDKMPPGILDVLKPYVDYHDEVDGVDYRRNIFIFLSNSGGNDITKIVFDFWLNDKRREDIQLKDMESHINMGAFNEKGGLQHSEIMKRDLIDLYVPFLPLEKKHIKLCIQDILRANKHPVSPSMLDKIADQMLYVPNDFQLYSSSGCKKVSQKVDIYAYDD